MLMLKPLPIDRSAADARFSVITFIAHVGFDTQELAHMLDSLVRVSRRVEWNHLVNIAMSGRCPANQIHESASADTEEAARQHNLTLKNQYGGEFCKARSPTQGQATMSN